MTALICLVGRDTVFVAADCVTHEPGTGLIVRNDTHKLRQLESGIAWAVGGYDVAIERIATALSEAHQDDIYSVNQLVLDTSRLVNEEMAPIAAQQGIEQQNVFSIVAGLAVDRSPKALISAPSLNQFLDVPRGQCSGLGTNSERIREIALEQANALISYGGVPADIWAIKVMGIASQEFPGSIGFPVDMVSISARRTTQAQRVTDQNGYEASNKWRVLL